MKRQYYLIIVIIAGLQGVHSKVSLSSRVIPHEVRRQGLDQENPCPGDMVEFTCTRSDSSASVVRWIRDEIIIYTFLIPDDIQLNSTKMREGLPATLENNTSTILTIDLKVHGTNNSVITCEESDSSTVSQTLTIIGLASSPSLNVTILYRLSELSVNVLVPEYGKECVDMYRVTVVVSGITKSKQTHAADPKRTLYTFLFPIGDLCQDTKDKIINVTAVAETNGTEGVEKSNIVNVTQKIIKSNESNVSASHYFHSSGVRVVLKWQSIDQNLTVYPKEVNVSCQFEGSVIDCENKRNSDNKWTVLLLYRYDLKEKDVSFTLSYELCGISESVNTTLTVHNVNSSMPKITQDSVTVDFNEELFDVKSVIACFSSNCTSTVREDYTNHIVIRIPDTGTNTGQCHFSIQLVNITRNCNDNQQNDIGYPIEGFFPAKPKPNLLQFFLAPTIGIPSLAIIPCLVVWWWCRIRRR